MEGYLTALALAALPALGNFAGGLLSEFFNVTQRALSFALHAAAGIILGVIAVELIPESLRAATPWIVILAFAAGGAFFIAIDAILGVVQKRIGSPEADSAGAWAIFFGVAVDLFSDGVIIGTASTIDFKMGLLLALAQVPADIPEGFATIANFKAQGVARGRRLLLGGLFTVPILVGTTVGYWAVREQPEIYKLALLAFTAGILLTVAIEEMIPEAHKGGDARWATGFLVGGFALFALLATYFG
ncbi:MAG TPA: ZIP family metal transporter [Pyrinomonadaceae bacterium]|nr:ZIP family metal transporter [Pyrinomonadaceae bacterium]